VVVANAAVLLLRHQFALVVPPIYQGYTWSTTGRLKVGGGLNHVEEAIFGQ